MFIDEFHIAENDRIRVTADQASRFAKHVAGDLNPIHNPDARRFCVPGDLLFALVLARFGLFQHMSFHFHNMVGDQTPLLFKEQTDGGITVVDDTGKLYLQVERSGEVTRDEGVVEGFARRYVAFSGLNFPHYLKPLLEEKGVMFNPQRPLVIYDSMGFTMQELDASEPGLEFSGSSMEVDGKRAVAHLEFRMTSAGRTTGTGSKKLVVSGLRPYDAQIMEDIIAEFYRRKAAYEEGMRAER